MKFDLTISRLFVKKILILNLHFPGRVVRHSPLTGFFIVREQYSQDQKEPPGHDGLRPHAGYPRLYHEAHRPNLRSLPSAQETLGPGTLGLEQTWSALGRRLPNRTQNLQPRPPVSQRYTHSTAPSIRGHQYLYNILFDSHI